MVLSMTPRSLTLGAVNDTTESDSVLSMTPRNFCTCEYPWEMETKYQSSSAYEYWAWAYIVISYTLQSNFPDFHSTLTILNKWKILCLCLAHAHAAQSLTKHGPWAQCGNRFIAVIRNEVFFLILVCIPVGCIS